MTGRSTAAESRDLLSMRKLIPYSVVLFLAGLSFQCGVLAGDSVRIAEFSAAQVGRGMPDGWELLDFPKIKEKTVYRIVEDRNYGAVIHAQSSSGSGGWLRPLQIQAADFPMLSWVWKIEATMTGSVVGSQEGDDFPARLLVSFKTDNEAASSPYDNALCYVWADREPVDTAQLNPFHDHVMTVVAANADDRVGDWLEITRDVVADYRAAFGTEPLQISAVTVMADGDNTGSEARAWFGPITFTGQEQTAP